MCPGFNQGFFMHFILVQQLVETKWKLPEVEMVLVEYATLLTNSTARPADLICQLSGENLLLSGQNCQPSGLVRQPSGHFLQPSGVIWQPSGPKIRSKKVIRQPSGVILRCWREKKTTFWAFPTTFWRRPATFWPFPTTLWWNSPTLWRKNKVAFELFQAIPFV